MPYRDVKTIWVERTEKHRVSVRLKTGVAEDLGVAGTEDEARVLSDARWARGDVESGCWEPIYRMPDGTELAMKDLPVGAVWDSPVYHDYAPWCGPDGLALWCKLPNGHEWHIDGRANNCTSPCGTCGVPYHQHHERSPQCQYVDRVPDHKCWCRAGDPRKNELHITKQGKTCAAGAGSILSGDYHGFLKHGVLEDCDRSAEMAAARTEWRAAVPTAERNGPSGIEQVEQPPRRGGIQTRRPGYGNAGS